MRNLILASGSPRRRELLEGLGFRFDTIVHDFDEASLDHLAPDRRVLALARAKAESVLEEARAGEAIVIAADTLVCDPLPPAPEARGFMDASGSITLGKPRGEDEARLMLRILSGRAHSVHTGVAILDTRNGRGEELLSTSTVRFAPLAEREIEAYLLSREWEGVAGAYRIQGLAALFIEELRGSWSGIVGLPIHELYAMLTRLEIEIPALSPVQIPPFEAR